MNALKLGCLQQRQLALVSSETRRGAARTRDKVELWEEFG